MIRTIPPFAEANKKYGIKGVEDAAFKKLAQKKFDSKGHSLEGR